MVVGVGRSLSDGDSIETVDGLLALVDELIVGVFDVSDWADGHWLLRLIVDIDSSFYASKAIFLAFKSSDFI